MSALSRNAQALPVTGAAPSLVDDLILARIACTGGASRAQIVRDLAPLMAPHLPAAQWRTAADTTLARLLVAGHVRDARGRLRLTDTGEAAVAAYFGEKEAAARSWTDQRDIWLTAKALGVDAGKPALRTALSRPDGLSALIVQRAFGLAVRQALSPSKLRAALALVAIERAFGGNVKEGLGKGSALSAQAGRVLAGQLLSKPRELPTDARLISALCGDQIGQQRFDIDAMRLAVLRRLHSTIAPEGYPTAACPDQLAHGWRINLPAAQDPHTTSGRNAAAAWIDAIFCRCAQRGTHPRRGLARGPQGVYFESVGRDSHLAPRMGALRIRVQGHAVRRPSRRAAGAERCRPQEQTEHQGV